MAKLNWGQPRGTKLHWSVTEQDRPKGGTEYGQLLFRDNRLYRLRKATERRKVHAFLASAPTAPMQPPKRLTQEQKDAARKHLQPDYHRG